MKNFFILFFIVAFQLCLGQSLIEQIKFDNLGNDERIKIEKINQLLPQSTKLREQNCNRYAMKYYGCILEYRMIYLYNNEPIAMDEANFNRITAMRSDGTEKTNNYMTNTRTYILNWNDKKFVSKSATISENGISMTDNFYLDKAEIERMMKKTE
ncbi:hypothetical protein CLU97_1592 [Chryseobacterium sp. 7]|uniref:hypothetical protein n=1 Tax=Chryseobacterium sp. 7 TaxID=2035214 RepID=UPI000EAC4CC6|nr:hypothetical protein [Chryseobacterium sp. 7]RLJ32146.1 hypothetical protein CLU97_1592 [Chryseobacterium sp. 7]